MILIGRQKHVFTLQAQKYTQWTPSNLFSHFTVGHSKSDDYTQNCNKFHIGIFNSAVSSGHLPVCSFLITFVFMNHNNWCTRGGLTYSNWHLLCQNSRTTGRHCKLYPRTHHIQPVSFLVMLLEKQKHNMNQQYDNITWVITWVPSVKSERSPEFHLRVVGKAHRGSEWLQLREQLLHNYELRVTKCKRPWRSAAKDLWHPIQCGLPTSRCSLLGPPAGSNHTWINWKDCRISEQQRLAKDEKWFIKVFSIIIKQLLLWNKHRQVRRKFFRLLPFRVATADHLAYLIWKEFYPGCLTQPFPPGFGPACKPPTLWFIDS